MLRDFLTSLGNKTERNDIILCTTPRAFISSPVLSIVVMLPSGAPAGVAVRVQWFSAGAVCGGKAGWTIAPAPGSPALVAEVNSQWWEVRS